ncbi:hypothetical protein SEPCBS119000_006636 [Sporothrix epigloea]|uniref:FHA domain-containing protein n=1 Tax=Sporothrix epigloea TaxID=1892477 RepID=A0ABP0E794_9PEZI
MSTDGDDPATGYESIVVGLIPISLPTSHDSLVRRIRLTSNRPKVNVGRASKTVSKGLLPAAENAYFDSPVVSRVHAEIAANFKNGIVSITDTGSLHGTSVNDRSLQKGVATPLKEDDTVSFGIHVSRGLDVFGPMACKVAFSRTSARPAEKARSYCAPDPESGISDTSDSDCSSMSYNAKNYGTGLISSNAEDIEIVDITVAAATAHLPSASEDCEPGSDSELGSGCGYMESIEEDGEFCATTTRLLSVERSESDEEEWLNGDHEDSEVVQDEEELGSESSAECEATYGENQAQEFKDIDNQSMFSMPPPFPPAKEASPSGGDFSSFSGLKTPPLMLAEDLAAGDYVSFGETFTDRIPKCTTTVKCDISSILNPSPISSPPKLADDDVLLLDPVDRLNTQDVLDATTSWNVEKVSALLTEPSSSEEPRMTSALAGNQEHTHLSPNATSLSSQVATSNERAASPGQESFNLVVDEMPADEPLEAVLGKKEDNALASAASSSKQKSNRKRKADEMVTETEVELSEKREAPAKRRATPAAVAATTSINRRMWAVAEKIGIAALGGAVVLGTLIYTAPSF